MADVGHLRDDLKLVRHAFFAGLADGLRQHVPGGVGIVVKGGALCALCALLHFGLGLDIPTTLLSGVLSGVALFAFDHLRGR